MGEAFQWGGNASRNLTLPHAFVARHSWQISGTDRTRSQFVAPEAKGRPVQLDLSGIQRQLGEDFKAKCAGEAVFH